MDKWEKIAGVIAAGIDNEDLESVFAGVMKLIVEFGRTFELLSEDLDRLATAAEKANGPFTVAAPEPQPEPQPEAE